MPNRPSRATPEFRTYSIGGMRSVEKVRIVGHGEQKNGQVACSCKLERPSNEVRHVDPGYLTPATSSKES